MGSFCKTHLITFGAVFMLLTFLLFGVACGVQNLFAINLHLNQDMIPHNTPFSPSSLSSVTSLSSHPLAPALSHPAFVGAVSKLADSTDMFDVKADTFYSYFQFCFDFSLTLPPVAPNSTDVNPSFSLSYQCKFIDSSCSVDMRSIIYDIAAALGQDTNEVPPEVMDMLKSIHVISNCDQYNASRGFAAMSCILGLLGVIFAILLWRKKLTLTPFAVTSFIVGCFAIVAISLLIASEQSDDTFAYIGLVNSLIPGAITMNFGIGFIPLVGAAFCALVTAIICAVEMWDRSQGGHVNPFSLQAHPESGILESHISMYQQM